MVKNKDYKKKESQTETAWLRRIPLLLVIVLLGCLLGQHYQLLSREIAAREILKNEGAKVRQDTGEGTQSNLAAEGEKRQNAVRGHAAWKDGRESDAVILSEQEQKGASAKEQEESQQREEQEEVLQTEEPLMRVLLMTDGYEGYYHSSVTVEADGVETVYSPENVGDEPVRIAPENGSFAVTSLERARGVPVYEGTLEIYGTDQGLLLVNELPLESYLCQVVPSEMPSSYETEALKAQAVCARTYAWRQYQDEKLINYHAHVDDSVAFQVYGNVQGNEKTRQAVEETAGMILCQNGEPIQAYYFSTSAGATSTDEVWEAEEEAGYLQSVACVYDAAEPWSQWTVYFPVSLLNERIQEYYGEIGSLVSLEIMEKSTGGAVKELRILTDQESRIVHNEYDIRALFSPEGLTITRKDESTAPGGSLLPSAYFRLDTVQGENGMEGYTFIGGGYGHGVGMSQNGANHMAMEGSSWQDILNYFYKDITLTKLTYEET